MDIDKHAEGIYKQDRLVGNGFMTGDPMDFMSQEDLWLRQNILTKVNVMKVILRISPYSVRMRENAEKCGPE